MSAAHSGPNNKGEMAFMKRRRMVAALLACIMVALLLPLAALAEGEEVSISVSGANDTLAPGDYLSVNILFDKAVASFGGAQFYVSYDSEKLEFVSYTQLWGSGEQSEDSAVNLGEDKGSGKFFILLVNSAAITKGGDTSIAAGTKIGNLVFKVKEGAEGSASYSIISTDFEATADGTTKLTASADMFTAKTVTIAQSVEYPTDGAPTIYCITSEADGTVTLTLKANGVVNLNRLSLTLDLSGYTDIAAASDCPFSVTISGTKAAITYAADGTGVDLSRGVAVLTMKKSGDTQSISAAPDSISYKDDKGELSPITKPTVVEDPLGGYEMGDVNRDGSVTVTDAVMVLKNAISLTELDAQQLLLADANGDGTITVTDAVMILKKAIGLLDF
jgi:hypothetical protein